MRSVWKTASLWVKFGVQKLLYTTKIIFVSHNESARPFSTLLPPFSVGPIGLVIALLDPRHSRQGVFNCIRA